MRYSLGSAVVIATTFVMAAFYWPANRPEPSLQLQAQDAPKAADVGSIPARKSPDLVSAQATKTASIRDDLTAKLEFRDFELKLDNVPWQEAIQFLSDVSDVDVLIDRRFVEETGVEMEMPVQLKARQGALSVRSAMELILEQVAGMQLAYAVRDGVILISTPDNAYENRVYDCRDLLEGVVVHPPGGVVGGGGGFGGGFGGGGAGGGHFRVRAEMLGAALQPTTMAQIGGLGGGGFGGEGGLGGGGMDPAVATSAAGPTLIHVIQEATAPAQWVKVDGEGGTVTEYDGLLIVRHQPRVHHKIEELLDQIRTVRANKRIDVPQAGAQLGPATRQDDFAPRLPSNDTADFGIGSDSPAIIHAVLELGGG